MTVRDFLTTLRQRWRLVLATMLVVVAATALATLQTRPIYESSTRVYLLANNQTDVGE